MASSNYSKQIAILVMKMNYLLAKQPDDQFQHNQNIINQNLSFKYH